MGNKLIRINRYGHHDDDFTKQKSQDEFRAVMLGNSITMGHGMNSSETFSNQLENMLKNCSPNITNQTYQIINTGVQGYSVFQEYEILKESMVFEPDFVAIGFCMNDVTEPFVINRDFGGTGLDYHRVMQVSNPFLSYLLNETGYGICIQKLRSRSTSLERERLREIYNVKHMTLHSKNDPKIQEAWRIVLADLSKVYNFAKGNNVDLVLLIFPYTFQFLNDDLKFPQKILIKHAQQHSIDFIDFTQVFEDIIFSDINVITYVKQEQFSYDDINRLYQKEIDKYFLDNDHYTIEGHRIVALKLFEYLKQKELIEILDNGGN